MADNADIASQVAERHLDNALANRPKLIGIDWAAADCEDCGEPIPEQRRQAAPWATTCIECQGIREKRERHVC